MSAFAGTGSVPELESDDGVRFSRIPSHPRAHLYDTLQEDDWNEEERQNQGFSHEEFQMLSEMLGPKGMAFDNDEVLDDNDDEDLKSDPISQMDMTVRPPHSPMFTDANTFCTSGPPYRVLQGMRFPKHQQLHERFRPTHPRREPRLEAGYRDLRIAVYGESEIRISI